MGRFTLVTHDIISDMLVPLISVADAYAAPELVNTAATGAVQSNPTANYGRIDTSFTLTNGRRVTKIRVYETVARSNISVFVLEANGMIMTTRAVLTNQTHDGAGWNEYVLSESYVVPDTGTFYIGTWSSDGWKWGMANGYYIASASWSTTFGGTATALAASGYCTRTGVEYVDKITGVLSDWIESRVPAQTSVSSLGGGVIANLFNGIYNTNEGVWVPDGGWVQYDFLKVVPAARIKFSLNNYLAAGTYNIVVSDDGITWNTVWTGTGGTMIGTGWCGYNVLPSSYLELGGCRYVRVPLLSTFWMSELWADYKAITSDVALADGTQYIVAGPDGVRVGMSGAPASTENVTSAISSVTGSDLHSAASVSGWITNAADTGYIDYIFSTPTQVDEVKLTGHASLPDRTPSAFTFVADPDGQNVTLVSASGLTWAAGEQKTFPCAQSVTVQTKLRLNYTATAHGYSQEYYCGAVQLLKQLSAVDASLPTYDPITGMWSDSKVQHILGWVEVVNGVITQSMQCAVGAYTELAPLGTVLPNPFMYLPIMATQDANVRPVVNNQITGVSTSGGVVRVWRIS